MLSSIVIENFRCFNHLQVKGFKSINLIGGQNNSGKTALLEALLLSSFPSLNTIEVLRQFRNENGNLIKKANEKVWNYFFYNQGLKCRFYLRILVWFCYPFYHSP